nr:hypothetical protein [Tanacetum cinerariifolium]
TGSLKGRVKRRLCCMCVLFQGIDADATNNLGAIGLGATYKRRMSRWR